jgi:hypothetical protein
LAMILCMNSGIPSQGTIPKKFNQLKTASKQTKNFELKPILSLQS